jgi:hypothetical protein
MKKSSRLFLLALLLGTLALLPGCESSGDYYGSSSVYYGVGYGDPFFYGGYYHNDIVVVAPPHGGYNRPNRPTPLPARPPMRPR